MVEDTIERLALLKRANRDRPMVMICDNNLLDVKASCANLTLWGTFLEANSLRERDLQGHYDLVLHLSDEDCPGNELQRLQCIWKDFPSYHHFSYDSAQSSELNVRQPLMVVSDYLGLGREDCNLQHNIA